MTAPRAVTAGERKALEAAGRMCVALDRIAAGFAARGGADPDAVGLGVRALLAARADYDRAVFALPSRAAKRGAP